MRIYFKNVDHEKISISVSSGNTNSNFGLERGESHELDFADSVAHAWWPKDDPITRDQLDRYGSQLNADSDIIYGEPLGKVT